MNSKSQIVNGKSNPPLPLRYYTGGQVPRRTGIGPSSSGFTFVELIVVIICIAILILTIGIRFNRIDTASAVAIDQLAADIRYVQLRAMSIGVQQSVVFTLSSGNYIAAGENKKLPQDITVINTNLAAHTLSFNTIGEPTYGTGDGTITLSSGNPITIHGITGEVE